MIENYVKIRKGTEPTTAFRIAMKVICDFLLSNSHNFKVDNTIRIELSIDRERR